MAGRPSDHDATPAGAGEPALTADGPVDVLLLGAGLANSLIALCLRRFRPELSILLVERAAAIGGNHTWSFHTTDVSSQEYALLAPMIAATWSSQEVRFPQFTRVTSTAYNSLTSERLAAAVSAELAGRIITGATVVEVGPQHARLADGRRLEARLVVDGRGARPSDALLLGYQKFVGLEVELAAPHNSARPVIMDATVEQIDGYRFVYTLPFSPTRLLIEDTYYSDAADLDVSALADRCRAYATVRGWRIADIIRQEQGVLPITLAGRIDRFWAEGDNGACRAGMRAGLFHPTTGYSLPDAMHVAMMLSGLKDLSTRTAAVAVERHSRQAWKDRGFFRLLNRMLMLAAQGAERRDVLERFYTLPQGLIERFYAARLTQADKLRILMGRPPLPIVRAVGQLSEAQAYGQHARRLAAPGL
ncbi:MAG: lycopene beta-cyclase CrtY [Hyphomicrobiaceae bacterium]|nr:lycopene beta-cyclase CrtY [Hyphomicrobiaceae bacterium]